MIYTFGYIILNALSFVLIHQLGVHLPKMLMVFLATSYAIIIFHVLSYRTVLLAYQRLWQFKKSYLVLLISVFFMWGGTFIIPIYYTPAILMFTFMILTCICGSFFSYHKERKRLSLFTFIATTAILLVFYTLYYFVYPLKAYLMMVGGTLCTGIFAYTYFWQSYQFSLAKFTSNEILAVRFWLLLLVPFIVVIKDQSYLQVNGHMLIETFFLSCFTLVLPIFCSQKSIEKIGANAHSVFIALTPFVTFLLEKIVVKTRINAVGYLSILLAVVILLPYLARTRFLRFNASATTLPPKRAP